MSEAASEIERLKAENVRLLANAEKDIGYLAAYHHWCTINGCAPSSSDLIAACAALERLYEEIDRLRAENARLREALKKIATIQGGGDCCSVYEWFGYAKRIARAALAKQEDK